MSCPGLVLSINCNTTLLMASCVSLHRQRLLPSPSQWSGRSLRWHAQHLPAAALAEISVRGCCATGVVTS